MTASRININIILVIMIIIIILFNIVIINLFNIFIIDIISVYLATSWTEMLTYNYTATCEVRDVVQKLPSVILKKIVKRLVIRTIAAVIFLHQLLSNSRPCPDELCTVEIS